MLMLLSNSCSKPATACMQQVKQIQYGALSGNCACVLGAQIRLTQYDVCLQLHGVLARSKHPQRSEPDSVSSFSGQDVTLWVLSWICCSQVKHRHHRAMSWLCLSCEEQFRLRRHTPQCLGLNSCSQSQSRCIVGDCHKHVTITW